MRTIKIFALPSHQSEERTSGVDFARIIQPMKALDGYTDDDVRFEVTLYDIHKDKENSPKYLLDIAKNHDIIFFNYLNNPWGFAHMGAFARANGTKLVLDLDDSLWNIKIDNPSHGVYQKGGEHIRNFTAICNEVDAMTTTNDYLKHVIMNNTNKKAWNIKVFPNYINLDLYKHRCEFRNNGKIKLLHFGSTTHFNDLVDEEFAQGVDRIFKEYPNVSIKFIGAAIPRYKMRWGMRYEIDYGDQDIYKWIGEKFPSFMDEADIMVVPLTSDIYNRCKSAIKFLESGSAQKPGVWQDIRQYSEVINDGENGFLATKRQDWYKAIKKLIDDPKLRQEMGQKAFETVENDWQMKDHVKDYAAFFKQIMI